MAVTPGVIFIPFLPNTAVFGFELASASASVIPIIYLGCLAVAVDTGEMLKAAVPHFPARVVLQGQAGSGVVASAIVTHLISPSLFISSSRCTVKV